MVWDPTQAGRSKIYANYGRYYEQIPLDIADRELTVASGLLGWHDFDCDPFGKRPRPLQRRTTGAPRGPPSQNWRQ